MLKQFFDTWTIAGFYYVYGMIDDISAKIFRKFEKKKFSRKIFDKFRKTLELENYNNFTEIIENFLEEK